ncbi:SPOC domain-like protein [Anaeromyces robustus]|uniref:ATP-dependent DNA helicase II subunit 2 n=1 Tax=Anaeromyces robustus TaxID=1754192 RepID=A0A1Y1X3R8_9FUNG|nr:SPOC domain-like protein [Anaeromyces robustus]|eukprot:ORX80342.1 SPOC domain-like protein [Anaeromyces robustus]
MANKEVTIYIIDINSSMWVKDETTKLTGYDYAKKIVSELLHIKLINGRKTDKVGLILIGTKESDNSLADGESYLNISVKYPILQASLDMLNTVMNEIHDEHSYGDLLDSIVIASDMINSFCRNLKYKKTIYLITDGNSKILNDDEEQNASIAGFIVEKDIHLNIIVTNYGGDEESIKVENMTPLKKSNEQFFREFTQKANGEVWSVNEALEILNEYRTKDVRATTLLRGPLVIGTPPNSLEMTCWVYTKTKELTLPSAKKYSAVSEAAAGNEEEKTFAVDMERVYSIKMNTKEGEKEIEISPDNLVKGYRYGKSIVPFSSIDEEQLALQNEKGLTVLYFFPKEKLRREWLMSNVLKIVSEPMNKSSEECFSALVQSMAINNLVAVIKLVRIKNAQPRIGVAIPIIKANYDCMYWCQIPYSDDYRSYTFPSFRNILNPASEKKSKLDTKNVSSEEASKKFEELINSMDLTADEDNELFVPKTIYNVAYQYLYQCIRHKAINPNDPLPEKDDRLLSMTTPNPEIMEKSRGISQEIKEMFNVKKVDLKNNDKKGFGEVVDNEIKNLINDIKNPESNVKFKTEEEIKNMRMENIIETNVKTIGSMNPVEDFKAMVKQQDAALLDKAFNQMKAMIFNLFYNALSNQSYEKILNCITVLRETCVKEDEGNLFNEFMQDLKKKLTIPDVDEKIYIHRNFWKIMIDQKINLIKSEGGKEGVTDEEYDQFLEIPTETVENSIKETSVENTGDIDDLFDMLE